jgi:hypothetical protein
VRVQPAHVAAAQGYAVAIQALKQMNRHLAAVFQPIAQMSSRELLIGRRGGNLPRDSNNLRHRCA